MPTYKVTLTPPANLPCNSTGKALFAAPFDVVVRADNALQACDLAQVMLPWRWDPATFEAKSGLISW
jgi:hypothetical protein